VHPEKAQGFKVVVNGGRETTVTHYVEEHKSLLAHLDALSVDQSPDGLFEYLFGERSRLAETMPRMLNIEYKEYCQFLGTFYLAAEFKRVPKTLEEHERIDHVGFMPYEQYNELWSQAAEIGKDGSGEKLCGRKCKMH
jgi:hypothetical protein